LRDRLNDDPSSPLLKSLYRLSIIHHLIVKPLGYTEKVDGHPTIVMLYHRADFDGQGNAFHKALQYGVNLMTGTPPSPFNILRDMMSHHSIDHQPIHEPWWHPEFLRVSTTPHALDGSQHCVQFRNRMVIKRPRLFLLYQIEQKALLRRIAEI
jgi:hypothetical protein